MIPDDNLPIPADSTGSDCQFNNVATHNTTNTALTLTWCLDVDIIGIAVA